MTAEQKVKELTRLLCQWNRREITPEQFALRTWALFEEEALETWNDPLEALLCH